MFRTLYIFLLPNLSFPVAQQSKSVLGRLLLEVSRSHSDTPHSGGLLWTSDQPDAETSNRQHTTLKRDKHPRSPVRFESTIPASPRPKAHALDRTVSGIGPSSKYPIQFYHYMEHRNKLFMFHTAWVLNSMKSFKCKRKLADKF
jgi:hypothetical protein